MGGKSYLFIGGIFPESYKDEIINNSKTNIQYAANNFQLALIDGLSHHLGAKLDLINLPFVGSYPKHYKKIKIPKFTFKFNELDNNLNVNFLNIWGYKNVSRYLNLKKNLSKWCEKNVESEKIIFIYSVHNPFLKAAVSLKIKYNLKICLIAPDLPEYMNLGKKKNAIFNYLKLYDMKKIDENIQFIDYFVVLTEFMMNKLVKKNKPYIVVEGIIDQNLFEKISASDLLEKKSKSKKIMLYTGTLDRKYGILKLVQLFNEIEEKNLQLIIYGEGDSKKEIQHICEKDNRIKFKGLVSREEILYQQSIADVLINPRSSKEEYTKYSFPSKNIEYMASGTPILTAELKGMPKEYLEYVYLIDEETNEAMKKSITDALNKEKKHLVSDGLIAKQFILENKNSIVQAKKILSLVNGDVDF